MRQHLIPALLALVLFAVSLNAYDILGKWYGRRTVAIEWTGVEVKTPEVMPGGTLRMVYTAKINKQCPSDLRGFIIGPDGTVPVRMPVVAGGYSRHSEDVREIPVAITIPPSPDPNMAPYVSGRYVYRTLATRYCSDGVEEDSSIPDAPFLLVLKP